MANHFILLFTLFLAHLADANNCDGQYITNEEDIFQGIEKDIEWGTVTPVSRLLLGIILPLRGNFQNICRHNADQKLSVCIKVLQHKFKEFSPTSFTVDPTKSDFKCRDVRLLGRDNKLYKQQMYACPTTTVKYTHEDDYECLDEEPQFLLGPGYHETEIRVRFTDGRSTGHPVTILGQLTGFDKKALNFKKSPNGRYTYRPHDSDSDGDASGSRPTRRMDDFSSDLREPLLRKKN